VPLTAAWVVIACALASALFPQLIAPYTPTAMDSNAILQPPLGAHMLGTDQFGRDVLSLVIFGARESLLLAAAAVLLSCSTGVAIGLIAGYTGGVVDLVLMRIIDVWMAIPNILLAIAICTARGPSTESTILAISVVMVARYARVLRGQALAVRSRPFILAARAAGASHLSILRRHVLPHCFAPVLVMATLGVGTSILLGASLSFLGLGVNDERPDWGYLLTQGRGYLTVAWWTVTYPGLAITLLCVSINLLGDALRRKLEPRRDGNKP
jgi:peptide/nickel transport system permease protein